jgi:DinB family protein
MVGARGRRALRGLGDQCLRAHSVSRRRARWAVTFDYHAHPLDLALATVDAVRANTLALLHRLPDSAWTRVGRHTGSGRYGAEDWLRIYAAHLEDHAAQIEANVAAWKTASR